MWMDLETVTQSHKKKNKYYILIHIYEIWQMAQMVLFAKQKQRHRHREQAYGQQGEKGGMKWEIEIDIC